MSKETNLTPKRKAFNEKYQNYTEAEIQKEILYAQKILIEKTEKVRKNTSNLVTFLVAIPLIFGLLYLVFTFGRNGSI
ncbi:hypothetical protein BTO06_17565 [Tenacibaculum sp. SZ-18]|uniref:hypothetical protein n=1 Tax=Tenacibaculum sp. SZ-18 TaxID=754423 RepID=UPI000C2D18E7|nr:hypothetical protein [Tenacibaculum sp. SZ-18]AUC16841.1 hypothetical protein BTO06_17565 [Tenacibaculum sp. SZ-18]